MILLKSILGVYLMCVIHFASCPLVDFTRSKYIRSSVVLENDVVKLDF